MVEVDLLAPDSAGDAALVGELVRLVNTAYAVGEAALWLAGTPRTRPDEIAGAIRSGGMLAATAAGQVIGCAYARPLDAATADLGLVSAAPDHWGSGIGRALVLAAEQLMHSRGASAMQLELLVPKGSTHPEKERLRDSYGRLGYRVTRTAPFEEVAAHLAPRLATPCEFLILHKRLMAHGDPDASTEQPKEGRRPTPGSADCVQ
jgi:GNAT superfamily N-acetyltransferase